MDKNQSSPEEIKEIHRQILEKMEPPKNQWLENLSRWIKNTRLSKWLSENAEKIGDKLEPVFEKIGNFFQSLGKGIGRFIDFIMKSPPILKILLLLLLIALAVFIIILIVKKVKAKSPSLSPEVKPGATGFTGPLTQSQEIYQMALEKGNEGKFDDAILILHRGSVFYLYEQDKLDKYRDYTNREITGSLDEKPEAFQTLAIKAESVLFGERKMKKNDFEAMKKLYKENFYA